MGNRNGDQGVGTDNESTRVPPGASYRIGNWHVYLVCILGLMYYACFAADCLPGEPEHLAISQNQVTK